MKIRNNKTCAECQDPIDEFTQYWVDTHTANEDGPYFHLRDECWDGDPGHKYPHSNGVIPYREPQLSPEQAAIANAAADLWMLPVRDGVVSKPEHIANFEATADDIREGWCLQDTAEATVDHVFVVLQRLQAMRKAETERYQEAMAAGEVNIA